MRQGALRTVVEIVEALSREFPHEKCYYSDDGNTTSDSNADYRTSAKTATVV